MEYDNERILAELILKVRFGAATEEEKNRVKEWLSESGEHRLLYERIVSGESVSEHMMLEQEVSCEVDLDRISKIIRERLQSRMFDRHRRIYRRISWAGIACAVVLGILFFVPSRNSVVDAVGNMTMAESGEKEDVNKVVLVLANGKKVGLNSQEKDSIPSAGESIVWENECLTYKRNSGVSDNVQQVEEWNKIMTFAGGEYSFILSDGTRVWLNAESELEFPVNFRGQERLVRLKGEAYFEVERDEDFPFIVDAGGIKTRVLGTSFDIKAYEEDEVISTTLLTGKVELSSADMGEKTVVLTPGMQGTWMKSGSEIQVEKVNTNKVMAWREGLFLFDNEKLSEVIKVLARWYDVSFVYDKTGDKEHIFSGSFSKDEPLDGILEILTYAGGPQFKKIGNVIQVEN